MKGTVLMTFLSNQEGESTKSLLKVQTPKDKKISTRFLTTTHQSSIQTFIFLCVLSLLVPINSVE